MLGLTWAMTSEAFSAALLTMSTETPRLHMPCSSGGVTWIKATSSGSWPELNRRGMSERKIGRVIAQAFLDDVAHVFGDEEAVDAEVLGQLAVGVGRLAEGQQVDDLRVGQFAGALGQGA